jgi:hypothetical protein
MEQEYWKNGGLPTHKTLEVLFGDEYSEEEYDEAVAKPPFKKALVSRGVPEAKVTAIQLKQTNSKNTLAASILTEQQLLVANTILDPLDKRSKLKKLTELGVSTQQYNTWLRDVNFRKYCLARAESLLLEAQPTAHLALIERVSQGDLGAIKYYNAMIGRYTPDAGRGVEVNVNNFNSDMLIKIVEIIQQHVKDPDVLAAIGQDILELQRGPQSEFKKAQAIYGTGVYLNA